MEYRDVDYHDDLLGRMTVLYGRLRRLSVCTFKQLSWTFS